MTCDRCALASSTPGALQEAAPLLARTETTVTLGNITANNAGLGLHSSGLQVLRECIADLLSLDGQDGRGKAFWGLRDHCTWRIGSGIRNLQQWWVRRTATSRLILWPTET